MSTRGDDAERERRLAERAVELAATAWPGADIEVAVDRNRHSLTRFATSVIHQNVAEDGTTLAVRVHRDGRTAAGRGIASDEAALAAIVERTVAAAALAPLDPGWPGVAGPAESTPKAELEHATAEVTPAERADVVAAFVAGADGLETAGFCRTNVWRGGRATSAGWSVQASAAECGVSGIARAPYAGGEAPSDGCARHAPVSFGELDGFRLGSVAAAKARAGRNPVELPPGHYEVVLEPPAVADLLEALCGLGFDGQAANDGISFARLGDDQLDPALTIVDDPLAVGQTVDDEATPRTRLMLCAAGRTAALTYDRRSAHEAGAVSTGHGVASRFGFGSMARHATILAADTAPAPADDRESPVLDASVLDLVAGGERGILVSDFWYTRVLDPRQLTLTGLTRNGVWLIEHGEIVAPLRNLRFTQSYVQALMPGRVAAVGRSAWSTPGDTYSATAPRWTAPALHLRSWNFTGGAAG